MDMALIHLGIRLECDTCHAEAHELGRCRACGSGYVDRVTDRAPAFDRYLVGASAHTAGVG
jgi:hypothetical protein